MWACLIVAISAISSLKRDTSKYGKILFIGLAVVVLVAAAVCLSSCVALDRPFSKCIVSLIFIPAILVLCTPIIFIVGTVTCSILLLTVSRSSIIPLELAQVPNPPPSA